MITYNVYEHDVVWDNLIVSNVSLGEAQSLVQESRGAYYYEEAKQ